MKSAAVLIGTLATLAVGAHGAPCVSDSGKKVINVDEWLCLVERASRAHSGLSQQEFLVRLRKRYYGGGGDSWGNVPSIGKVLGIKNLWDLVIPAGADSPTLDLSADSEADAFLSPKFQEIEGPDGKKFDVGHTVVGVESCRSPKASNYFRFGLGISRGPPTATWAGDAGTALSDLAVRRRSQPGYSLERSFAQASSDEDMRGNADAYAIHGMWAMRPGKTLVQVLRAYYGEGLDSVCARSRYSGFALVGGFVGTDGRAKNGVVRKVRKTIHANARAPMIKSGKGALGKAAAFFNHMPWSDAEFDEVLRKFMAEGLNDGIRAESAKERSFSARTAAHYKPSSCAFFE